MITRKIYIRGPVVLRGAGRDATTLYLPKSLSQASTPSARAARRRHTRPSHGRLACRAPPPSLWNPPPP